MYELLWIAAGATAGWAAAHMRRARGVAPQEAPEQPAEPEAGPSRVEVAVSPDSWAMARSLAEELSTHATAIEARAHHLIEAAPARDNLPGAAAAMMTSVERLRTLHTKLLAFGRGRPVEAGTTDIIALIQGLGDDLLQLQLGLELRWEPPAELPEVDANPAAVRDAMLFACAALLRAERGATRLTFSTERSFSTPRPTIKIEINLEWTTVPQHREGTTTLDHSFALDWEAAKQLVESHGGELTLSHLPGKAVHAVLRLPLAVPSEEIVCAHADSVADDYEGITARDYGGALVLESDPALRAVLARELKASGRAVFACADGASAHTFLEATPDRFELLIVDDVQQLGRHTPLARTIRAHVPALKICLVSPAPASTDEWPQMRCLRKPFGVHELRRTLASILSAG